MVRRKNKNEKCLGGLFRLVISKPRFKRSEVQGDLPEKNVRSSTGIVVNAPNKKVRR